MILVSAIFDPALYECPLCDAKPGCPDLCRRCFEARTAAGDAWVGARRLFAAHEYTAGCACDPCAAARAPRPLPEPIALIACCNKAPPGCGFCAYCGVLRRSMRAHYIAAIWRSAWPW